MAGSEVLKIFRNLLHIDRSDGEADKVKMDEASKTKKGLSVKLIVESVADYYGFSIQELKDRSRKQEVVLARQIATYLLREYTGKSYPEIGRYFGSRDHTTVLYSHRKIDSLLMASPDLKLQVDEIIKIIFGDSPAIKTIVKENNQKERKVEINNEEKVEEWQSERVMPFFPRPSKPRPSRPPAPEVVERERDILSEYRSGKTLQQIGGERNLTRERIRQIVLKAIFREMEGRQREGFEIDSSEYLKQEKLKRERLRPRKEKEENKKPQRWSRFYAHCRGCGTTIIPHFKRGYCEKCLNIFGKKRRNELVGTLGGKCAHCGIDRYEARSKYGRDFYITSFEDRKIILCRGCFLSYTGGKLSESRARRNGF